MTTIAIADDSEVIRNLIEEVVRYEPELELVGSFENGREIVTWSREGGRADIYLIDMRLPVLSGTATIRALRRFISDARIIAFSASAQEASVEAAIDAGADQYVVKDASLGELLEALRTAPESAEPDAGAKSAGSATGTMSIPDRGDEHFTVLVIDDHEIVRETASALLESRGLGSVAFEDGESAIEWIQQGGRPEAALVDLRIGGERDTGLVSRLREVLPDAAIFVHSGVTNVDGMQVARSAGADGFIAKGELSADTLEEMLVGAVAQRRTSGA
jgi:DNA-binding NarL/FixJ family response regulator